MPMTYIDQIYYTGQGFSLIPAHAFLFVAAKASRYIDKLTYNRLQYGCEVTEAVKMAVCAVADEMYKQEQEKAGERPGVVSESTDGYSVSYAAQKDLKKEYTQRLAEAANLFLPSSDPLRYAGVVE